MKITRETLKFPQIDAAFRYILDNKFKYEFLEPDLRDRKYTQLKNQLGIIEFGVGKAQSLKKICQYVEDNNLKVHIMGYDSWDGLIKEQDGVPLFPKYGEGEYKFSANEALYVKLNNENVFLRECTFDSIPKEDANKICATVLIHIDSDIYLSAKQALNWCFKNKLVIQHTLIAFDEYFSVEDGGEEKAWKEICEEYCVEAQEVWHNIYTDKETKTQIRQNVWEVL